ENGCAVAALVSEMPRQSADVRAAAVQRVRSLVALVAQTLPADAAPDSAAAIASQMVGALQLARALGDNAEGQALLAANRSALLARYDTSQPAA
ncbi:MAG: TetR/AcrR family transcriptional regulator, partial [Rhodoferax sp.]|nr:TetR/AcrR family transcriptional regulator [Rhodoferax sp.]